MSILLACLSSGKGSWNHVNKLISQESWEKIYLITNSFGKENFTVPEGKPIELIVVDLRNNDLEILRDEIKEKLKDKINDTEIAVNLVSGTGPEHMAILAAILKIGVGMRFVISSEKNFKEI